MCRVRGSISCLKAQMSMITASRNERTKYDTCFLRERHIKNEVMSIRDVENVARTREAAQKY